MKEVKRRINCFHGNKITQKSAASLIAVVIFTAVGLATAGDNKLGITIDATYVSRYIWRGTDIYPNNHSAIQPSVAIDFYGTGFGLNTWSSRANRSGFENSEEIDYTLCYCNSLFKDESYAAEYGIGWI